MGARFPVRLAGALAAPALLAAGCSLWRGNAPGPVQVGTASWYGAELRGGRTASGERFDEHAFTAASPSLPIGTRVRVTNLANGRSAVVRINDRGPFARGRVLDVSHAAARALGMLGTGTARHDGASRAREPRASGGLSPAATARAADVRTAGAAARPPARSG